MATLNITLTIASSDATSDALGLNESLSTTIKVPVNNVNRISVSNSAATVLVAGSGADDTYIYIKNLDSTNFVEVKDDAGNTYAALEPSDFAFLPVSGAAGVEVQADTAACEVEYGFWTRG